MKFLYWFIVSVCLVFVLGVVCFADCSGLTPQLQKAYDQLKKDGFDVSCREGL